ncbi:unnamed protein product [Spirodela intermedia]|uniref:Uncharacterized protein n=1 Tax=Spirodela intermedia TaxID=51605 RepID=A0A7I8J254_SPIIN|nr:unnamed protein product [Spirodela intermedia]CAA6663451.1 unnamed protein product [Spirodela intermedia]
MVYIPVEISLFSAHDIVDGSLSSSQAEIFAYIVLTVGDEVYGYQRMPAADFDGENLLWRSTAKFAVPQESWNYQNIHILLRKRSRGREDDVGYARISVEDLSEKASEISASLWGSTFSFTCDITTTGGVQSGSLSLALRYGGRMLATNMPKIQLLALLLMGLLAWWLLRRMVCEVRAALNPGPSQAAGSRSHWRAILLLEVLLIVLTRL